MSISLIALAFGVALLVADSHLSAPFRNAIRRRWLREGLSCVQCVGFWAALLVSLVAYRSGGGLFDWSPLPTPRIVSPLLDALAGSGVLGWSGRMISAGSAPGAPVVVSQDGGRA